MLVGVSLYAYSIALILSRHSFNISFSSSTVVALSMAILVWRKSGMPLKIGEAARWRRVWRMPLYSSMRSTFDAKLLFQEVDFLIYG